MVGPELSKRKRHLPHWQKGGSVYFVTFRSARGRLCREALLQVRKTLLTDHGRRYILHFAVILPDHVHLLLQPKERRKGEWHDLTKILKSLKGISARRINQILGTTGSVWQHESFDRIVRDQKEFREKWDYMRQNPVKVGLVDTPDAYEFVIQPE